MSDKTKPDPDILRLVQQANPPKPEGYIENWDDICEQAASIPPKPQPPSLPQDQKGWPTFREIQVAHSKWYDSDPNIIVITGINAWYAAIEWLKSRTHLPSGNGGEKEEVIWEDMETGERVYPSDNGGEEWYCLDDESEMTKQEWIDHVLGLQKELKSKDQEIQRLKDKLQEYFDLALKTGQHVINIEAENNSLKPEIAKLKSGEQFSREFCCKFLEWACLEEREYYHINGRLLWDSDSKADTTRLLETDQLLDNYLTEVKQKK